MAAGIALSRGDYAGIITTDDANQSLISCSADLRSVTVQPTSAAGCYVIVKGQAQGSAVPSSGRIEVVALGSVTVTPNDCGSGVGQAWSFAVARVSAGAVIHLLGSQR
jgi:hypothetical protein